MKLWSEIILPATHAASSSKLSGKDNIIFLHGTGSGSRMWKNQVAFFSAQGYPCTVIDLRGHGASHEPYEKTDLAVHKNDVIETLKAHNVPLPAYFVGHSLGAIISVALAESHPELVRGVFAACLPGKVLPPVTMAFRAFINGPLQALKESDFRKQLGWREQILVEMPVFTLKEIANNFADIDFLNQLPDVKCPVHIAAARFDPIAVCGQAKKMHRKLPGSTLKIFEWAGHNAMDYRVSDFNNWIADYLE